MAKLDALDGSVIYTKENSRTILKADSIVDAVVDKFLQRAKVGQAKYGVNLDRTDLSLEDWLTHFQEELMDAVNYIEKIKKIITSK